ncbi:hypothetical protein RCH09_001036 [Actimicrobium sp. GrIS 1.19]|nr:hypothetical protein [Actimicrobium sp. GrIS 1.19]
MQFNFDVNTSWQIKLHQRIDGFVGWVNDIHQTDVCTNFELIARSLVDVRRAQNVKTLNAGRQGNRAFYNGTGTLGGFNDFKGRLIDQAVIECFQANANLLVLARHGIPLKSEPRMGASAAFWQNKQFIDELFTQ